MENKKALPEGSTLNRQLEFTPSRKKIQVCSLEGYEEIHPRYYCDELGNIYGEGGKALKPTYYGDKKYGYKGVTLFKKNGGKVHKSVGRIIALAFVDGRTAKRNDVDHINGDASDNRAENLRWLSHQENLDFMRLKQYREGKIKSSFKESERSTN